MAINPEDREQISRFPSNSHKTREEKKEVKKLEKIITGKVVQRKKSLGKKIMETFIPADIDNVVLYVIHDVLIPAAKSTLFDMIKGGAELSLFGESNKGTRTKRDRDRSYVSYNSYGNNRRDEKRDISSRDRARHNFDDIILDSRGEAEEVLSALVDLIVDYGQASVADLYDLVGITGTFTDYKWGWHNVDSASASIARGGGYALHLPKAILLD